MFSGWAYEAEEIVMGVDSNLVVVGVIRECS